MSKKKESWIEDYVLVLLLVIFVIWIFFIFLISVFLSPERIDCVENPELCICELTCGELLISSQTDEEVRLEECWNIKDIRDGVRCSLR